MERVTCQYCGLPFRVRKVAAGEAHFCCTGCAMLSRIPVDAEGQFPVNAHLVAALITGFILFNQLLFWLIAELLVREGRMAVAVRLFWLSGGAAAALWVSLLLLQRRVKALRGAEAVAMALGLAGLAWAFWRQPPRPLGLAGVSLVLTAWTFRGLLLRGFRAPKRAPKP